jgi:WD40 repeat protein
MNKLAPALFLLIFGGGSLRVVETREVPRPPRLDRYLAPLPDGAIARLGMAGERDAAVHSFRPVALSPDGKMLATVRGRIILVWDTASRKAVRRIVADRFSILTIAFGPDNSLAALGQNADRVMVWDVGTGAVRRSFPVPANWAGADFSADGRLLATTSAHPPNPNRLRVWDVAIGKQLFEDEEPFPTVFFLPDGKHVLTSRMEQKAKHETIVTVRDSQAGKVISRTRFPGRITFTDITPNGKLLVGLTFVDHKLQDHWRHRVQLFDLDTGECLRTLAETRIGAWGRARFTPDGKGVAALLDDSRCAVWDTATGKELHTFPCDTLYGTDLAFSRDGNTVYSAGRSVGAGDLKTGEHRYLSPGHLELVLSLAFTPDGKHLASGSQDGQVMIWDLASEQIVSELRRETKVFPPSPNHPQQMAFTPDGKHLLRCDDHWPVRLFNAFAGTEVAAFRGSGTVSLFAADGRTLLWSVHAPQAVARQAFPGHHTFSPSGAEQMWAATIHWLAATLVHPELRPLRPLVYRGPKSLPKVPEPAATLEAMFDGLGGVSASPVFLSPDGRLLVERLGVLTGNPASAMGMTWSAGGFRIVDACTGTPIAARPGTGEISEPLAISPDGRIIAVSNHVRLAAMVQPAVELRDLPAKLPLSQKPAPAPFALLETHGLGERLPLREPPNANAPLAFSPDGRWLVFSAHQGTLAALDLTRGKVVHTLRPDLPASCLAFSPDGKRLASGHGHTILLWDATRWPTPPSDAKTLTNAEHVQLWADLADADAARAYRAMVRLQERPDQAIAHLHAKLGVTVEAAKFEQLIANLDSDTFTTREEAAAALAKLSESARPFLRRALEHPRSLEHRCRLEGLLDKLGTPFSTPAALRLLRAVEVLERIGTTPAATLLRRLADATDDSLGPEARRSLERLRKL